MFLFVGAASHQSSSRTTMGQFLLLQASFAISDAFISVPAVPSICSALLCNNKRLASSVPASVFSPAHAGERLSGAGCGEREPHRQVWPSAAPPRRLIRFPAPRAGSRSVSTVKTHLGRTPALIVADVRAAPGERRRSRWEGVTDHSRGLGP